jgi:hypothetical protein
VRPHLCPQQRAEVLPQVGRRRRLDGLRRRRSPREPSPLHNVEDALDGEAVAAEVRQRRELASLAMNARVPRSRFLALPASNATGSMLRCTERVSPVARSIQR